MCTAFDLTVNALRAQGLNDHEILEELSKLFREIAEKNNQTNPAEDEEEKIRHMLKRVGLPTHISGFEYWEKAIIVYKQIGKLCMNKIYEKVADICDTTPIKVERGMRYAAEYTFKKCKKEDIEAIFGSHTYINRKKLTNLEFLSVLVEKI